MFHKATSDQLRAGPQISPGDQRRRPESIAVAMVEEARAHRQHQDQRGRIKRSVSGGKSSSIVITY